MNYQMIEYAVRRYIDEKKLFDGLERSIPIRLFVSIMRIRGMPKVSSEILIRTLIPRPV